MKRSIAIGTAALVAVLCVTVMAIAADNRSAEGTADLNRVKATVLEIEPGTSGTRAVGTLQYDNDTPFKRDITTDATVGNRFSPGVMDPHSIATVSFRLAQNYASDIIASVWDVNPASAVILTRFVVSGIPSGTVTGFVGVAPLPYPVGAHSGSFIGGVHNTFYTGLGCPSNSNLNGTCDGVALTQGTVNPGFGFNAAKIQLAGGVFTPPTTVVANTGTNISPPANAIFRVTGDNLPVELMNLSVE